MKTLSQNLLNTSSPSVKLQGISNQAMKQSLQIEHRLKKN